MTIEKAKVKGQSILGGMGAQQVYTLTLDDSWLAAGEVIDFSADFALIYGIQVLGSTVINPYKLDFILPAQGTAPSASNVKMTAHYSTDAAGAMTPVPDTTDISGIGPVQILVTGKPKVTVS